MLLIVTVTAEAKGSLQLWQDSVVGVCHMAPTVTSYIGVLTYDLCLEKNDSTFWEMRAWLLRMLSSEADDQSRIDYRRKVLILLLSWHLIRDNPVTIPLISMSSRVYDATDM
jgi:hypothetical protein